jgi:hypothetical protein
MNQNEDTSHVTLPCIRFYLHFLINVNDVRVASSFSWMTAMNLRDSNSTEDVEKRFDIRNASAWSVPKITIFRKSVWCAGESPSRAGGEGSPLD